MLEQCYCHECGEYMNMPVERSGKWYHNWCYPIAYCPECGEPTDYTGKQECMACAKIIIPTQY